jgi:hypothetical protein
MPEAIGSFAQFVGAAFISSDLGAAEFILGSLVGVGFFLLSTRSLSRETHAPNSRAHRR